MPRISMWRPNHGNDYKFFDRRISEMFTMGGTGVYLHKYLGPDGNATGTSSSLVTTNRAVGATTGATITLNESTVTTVGQPSGVEVGYRINIGNLLSTTVTAVNTASNTVTLASNVTQFIASSTAIVADTQFTLTTSETITDPYVLSFSPASVQVLSNVAQYESYIVSSPFFDGRANVVAVDYTLGTVTFNEPIIANVPVGTNVTLRHLTSGITLDTVFETIAETVTTNTVTVSNAANVRVGMSVASAAWDGTAVVTAVNTTANTVTVNVAMNAAVTTSTVFDFRLSTQFSLTQPILTANMISFSDISTQNITVGQRVLSEYFEYDVFPQVIAVNSVDNYATLDHAATSNSSGSTSIRVFWEKADQPKYLNQSEQNIQDLLFLENRDRKYDTDIYELRGIYQVADNDFDLSQFGIFLSADTKMITFHLNDTVEAIGRKIVSGDVIELQHLMDYNPLDITVPAALRKYYVVQDVTFASEGFSQTWWPHLLRVKVTPLVDSQEYKGILEQLVGETGNTANEVHSTYNRLLEINEAIVNQATQDTPRSGYDTSAYTVVNQRFGEDSTVPSTVPGAAPDGGIYQLDSYLGSETLIDTTGNRTNGGTTTYVQGTSFPASPTVGQFALRTDYSPNRLFRYDGRRWVKVNDSALSYRADINANSVQTQRGEFMNTAGTYETTSGQQVPIRQGLSKALTPEADN